MSYLRSFAHFRRFELNLTNHRLTVWIFDDHVQFSVEIARGWNPLPAVIQGRILLSNHSRRPIRLFRVINVDRCANSIGKLGWLDAFSRHLLTDAAWRLHFNVKLFTLLRGDKFGRFLPPDIIGDALNSLLKRWVGRRRSLNQILRRDQIFLVALERSL